MSRCEQCGAPFFSASTAWGGRRCGDCLADQIELSMLRHSLADQRKPMRWASSAADAVSEVVHERPERRSA